MDNNVEITGIFRALTMTDVANLLHIHKLILTKFMVGEYETMLLGYKGATNSLFR